MSWIFGILHKKEKHIHIENIIDETPLFKYANGRMELYSGGCLNTIHSSVDENPDESFLVSGIGLDEKSPGVRTFGRGEWSSALSSDRLKNIDGHFVTIRWSRNKLDIQTDVLGLRDIYIKDSPDRIIFSTRIDWIAKVENVSIDFMEFGSRWLLINQISHNSVFAGVKRLVCGSKAEIDLQSFNIVYTNYNWLPDTEDDKYGIQEFSADLKKSLRSVESHKFSLSLSGGMDSRVLLAGLLSGKEKEWDAHTFGDPAHPDSIIARRLSDDLNFRHVQIDSETSREDLLRGIETYSCQSITNNASSAFLQLKNYDEFKDGNAIYIDGGFGEIWRREFLNRLLWKDKQAIFDGDPQRMFRHLLLGRADIFKDEVNKMMHEGCLKQINEMMQLMPAPEEIKIENWLDLFAIKTRLVNYYAPEQARLDGALYNFMPFCRKSLLQNIFRLPVKAKSNGGIFKAIIRREYPKLAEYNLVKGSSYSPFYFNTLQTKILNKLKNKMNYGIYRSVRTNMYLDSIKEVVLDITHSNPVKNFPEYDYNKIKLIAEEYYKGKTDKAYSLDWFISFELLRKNIYEK